MRIYIILALTILSSCSAQAKEPNTTKTEAIACISEIYYDQILTAAKNDDQRGLVHLLENYNCFFVPEGTTYSLLNKGFEISLVRFYVGENTVEGYISNDEIN